MKNNNNNDIDQSRTNKLHQGANTDILVIPEVVRENQQRLANQPKRKRRRNYAKKIMNDAFLMSI